ncbi:MAG: hypothetical protein AAB508_03235 [Patescibacteria group bacterium]
MKTTSTLGVLATIGTLLYMIFSGTDDKSRDIETILMITPIAAAILSCIGIVLCIVAKLFNPMHIWLEHLRECIYVLVISVILIILYDLVYPLFIGLVKPTDVNTIGPISITAILAGFALWITMSLGYIGVTDSKNAYMTTQIVSFVGITLAFLYPLARALMMNELTLIIGLCFGLLIDYAFWYMWHFNHG